MKLKIPLAQRRELAAVVKQFKMGFARDYQRRITARRKREAIAEFRLSDAGRAALKDAPPHD